MSPEVREAMLAEADVHGCAREHWAEILDALTERGFSISLASVRDHTNCDVCEGTLEWPPHHRHPDAQAVDDLARIPCPGGSPVVWSTETMSAGWRSEARARLDAVNPAPWRYFTEYSEWDGCILGDEDDVLATDVRRGEGFFIAHAPTDLGRALDALDAVLALHQPDEYGDCPICGDWETSEEVAIVVPWPCPTVRAIEGTHD